MTEHGKRLRIQDLIYKYFNGDCKKVMLWLKSPNPNLGSYTPYQMMTIGRTQKLLDFVESSIAGNHP